MAVNEPYYEIALGNITEQDAERLGTAAGAVDDVFHIPGTAEPWVSRLVHGFTIAIGAYSVLETGSFQGGTSAWIVDALKRLGGGHLHLVEIDRERANATGRRLNLTDGTLKPVVLGEPVPGVRVTLSNVDVLEYLRDTTNRFDLAWVDDNHEKPHVRKELGLLYPRMNPGGLILGHDVWGVCELHEVFREFGGYSVGLPRLGAAGGIGIIQVPHADTSWRYSIPWKQLP